MSELLKKLNYKNQPEILVLNAPEDFESFLKEISKVTKVAAELKAKKEYSFIIVFAKSQKEVAAFIPKLVDAMIEDGLLWVAYPKGTSKKYKADISRDKGWEVLRKLGFETVRLISIDEDWSCMRFRKTEFIKSMSRSEAVVKSTEGKNKTKKK
ncbi:MAG TPA: hypothetical protein VK766_12155 [Cytophagaceae bacterium]|jgi:hypothetical protein|nr:hypothetical protein [Cytophagaceae bacterium]